MQRAYGWGVSIEAEDRITTRHTEEETPVASPLTPAWTISSSWFRCGEDRRFHHWQLSDPLWKLGSTGRTSPRCRQLEDLPIHLPGRPLDESQLDRFPAVHGLLPNTLHHRVVNDEPKPGVD